jgi:acyl carrier protein
MRLKMPMISFARNSDAQPLFSVADIQDWLVSYLAELSQVEPQTINIRDPIENYDLNSAQAMILIAKAEELLGIELSLLLVWHYPTIEALSHQIWEEIIAPK